MPVPGAIDGSNASMSIVKYKLISLGMWLIISLMLWFLNCLTEKISEIPGGAHRYPNEQALLVREKILKNLNELKNTDIETLILNRNRKYLDITSNI